MNVLKSIATLTDAYWWPHRELQRGVPPPYGEQFSKETLIKSASSKAIAATTEARIGQPDCWGHQVQCIKIDTFMCIGPGSDPLRDGFQATSLDGDEVVRLLDACIRHHDHFNGFKVAAMVLLGTSMGFRGKWWCCCALLHLWQLNCWIEMQVMTSWMQNLAYLPSHLLCAVCLCQCKSSHGKLTCWSNSTFFRLLQGILAILGSEGWQGWQASSVKY